MLYAAGRQRYLYRCTSPPVITLHDLLSLQRSKPRQARHEQFAYNLLCSFNHSMPEGV